MKILHLATQDVGGGGADASHRLHRAMQASGIDSRMLVLRKLGDDPSVTDMSSRLSPVERLGRLGHEVRRRWLRRRYRPSPYFYVESAGLVPVSAMMRRLPFAPDAIIAHWISGFADGGTLRELSARTGAPALWYLLDMAPLTGGCHYSFGCEGYRAACGQCPQLAAGRGEGDLSRRQWRDKAAALAPAEITGVAASSWLRARLDQSSVFRHKRHETILLGVDVHTFRRGSAADARRRLGLPDDRLVVFFGASSLHEERKGIRQLLEALHLLHGMLGTADPALRDRILVVTAGKAANAAEIDIPFEHRHIGFLEGDAQLVLAYQAADLFVNPSVEDAGPMMINEALLCGTPVVSFEMGVAADLVHTGETGYRARLRDAGDMADGIRRILALPGEELEAMRARCRAMGEDRCDPSVQVGAFAALCRDLIQTSRSVA